MIDLASAPRASTSDAPAPALAGMADPQGDALVKNASLVSACHGTSRVLGFVRDGVLLHVFGATPHLDAFLIAFSIPNALRTMVAEGAATVAFLPVLRRRYARGGVEALRHGVGQALVFFALLGLVVVGLALYGAPALGAMLAPGFVDDPDRLRETVGLVRLMLPFGALLMIAAVVHAALHVLHRFGVVAASWVVFNGATVLGLGLLTQLAVRIEHVALVVVFGGVLQLLVGLLALRRLDLLALRWPEPRGDVWIMFGALGPALLSVAGHHVNFFVGRMCASFLDPGAATFLYNAERFHQLPLGLFGVAVATVTLPQVTSHHLRGDQKALGQTLCDALRAVHAVLVPAAAGLAALSHPIAATVLQHGAFDAAMARSTARVLAILALGLPAVALSRVVAQVFFAVGKKRFSTLGGVVGVLANALMVWPLMSALGVVGIACSLTLAAWVHFVLQVMWVRKVVVLPRARIWCRFVARDLVATALMLLIVFRMVGWGHFDNGFSLPNLGCLAAAVGTGVLVYVGAQGAMGRRRL